MIFWILCGRNSLDDATKPTIRLIEILPLTLQVIRNYENCETLKLPQRNSNPTKSKTALDLILNRV